MIEELLLFSMITEKNSFSPIIHGFLLMKTRKQENSPLSTFIVALPVDDDISDSELIVDSIGTPAPVTRCTIHENS